MIRRSSRVLLEVLAMFTAGVAVLLVLAALRLSAGPLPLHFLTPHIEQALSPADGSFTVRLDETILTWAGWERTLDIRARGVRVVGAAGVERAAVPELSLSLSARALIKGLIAPTSLEIIGPRLTIVRTEQGGFKLFTGLPVAGGPAPGAAEDMLSRLVASLLRPPDPGRAMGYLRSVSILGADLTLDDQRRALSWHASPVDVEIFRDVRGVRGEASLDLAVGGGKAHFDLSGDYDMREGDVVLKVGFADIEPARFAAAAPLLGPLSAFQVPVSGEVNLTAGLGGRLRELSFDLSIGKGSISLPELFEDALEVQRIKTRGRLWDGLSRLTVDEFVVDLGGPTATVTAEISGLGGELEVKADAKARDLAIEDLKRYWPASMAPNARRWVVKNLDDGAFDEVRISLHARGQGRGVGDLEVVSVSGAMRYSGVSVIYFHPLPPVRNVAGTGRIAYDRLDFSFTAGELEDLRLDQGSLAVTGLDGDDQHATVEVVLRGPLRSALTVLDHPRLRYVSELGIAPAAVGGETAVRLVTRLPLVDALKFSQVEIAAAANLRDVRMPKVLFDLDLSGGALTLQLDKRGMDVRGDVRLGGVAVKIAWTENFREGARFRSVYRMTARLDDAARQRIGFDLGAYLRGPVDVDLVFTDIDRKRSEVSLAVDLREASMSVPEIGWSKAAGSEGAARISGSLVDGRLSRVEDFTIDAGDLKAAGSAALVRAGKTISRVDFSRLAFGETDVRAKVTVRPDGGYEIGLSGRALDVEPYIGFEKDSELPPLELSLELERVRLGPGRHLANVTGAMSHDGGKWRSITLDGELEGGKRFKFRLTPGGKGRKLLVESNDAGRVLRAFDIAENFIGGSLVVKGTYDDSLPDPPLTGRVRIKSYRVVKAPVLAKLLTVASFTGIVNLLSGRGIAFSRLEVPFTLVDGTVEFKNARTSGSELGFTAEGRINLEEGELDLKGTIVPAYTVNSVLGNIPILGTLLTGEEGGGVFAATFRMSGPMKDPKISVNPLATLTPGFLRGVFDIFEGGRTIPDEPDAESGPGGND